MENPDPKTEKKDAPALAGHESSAVATGLLPRLKSDRTLWFIVVFGVGGFFLAAALFAFFSGSKKTQKLPKPQAAPAVIPSVPAPAAPVVETPQPQSPPAESTVSSAVPTLSLSGILYSDAESLALINGRVVPEGGMVDGAKVEKISSDEVELSFEGQKIILRSR